MLTPLRTTAAVYVKQVPHREAQAQSTHSISQKTCAEGLNWQPASNQDCMQLTPRSTWTPCCRFDLSKVAGSQGDKTARKEALKIQKTALDALAEVRCENTSLCTEQHRAWHANMLIGGLDTLAFTSGVHMYMIESVVCNSFGQHCHSKSTCMRKLLLSEVSCPACYVAHPGHHSRAVSCNAQMV